MKKTYNELEYSNIIVWFDRTTFLSLLDTLHQNGLTVRVKEATHSIRMDITADSGGHQLVLAKNGERYKLEEYHYAVRDIRLAMILYQFIEQAKGHAVVKIINEHQILVKNIRYGEAVRIVKIKGAEKKVIYEKACNVTMDQVIAALKRRDAEERIPVLRLELDYELATLFDAIQSKNNEQVQRSKAHLRLLRKEMLLLEV
ncbi:hypothetical protein [Brevibacillus laterosporus]|uniref:hypothetical protein n=1 Tax=Brevibacillus laterosporus TaxID=1465 RepID=UPI000CE4E953|nr:hypothetical protein [Brevibacillus laterosporus]MED1663615.1 hypothetical protein [Brevibacillus laterosporus]MED1670883.1 hypothetical protein [Brevibacillus laterosporus]MED1718384.1 hypothetical protein [Brevibacillus laterosporus]PPA88900.1 hypothetical protein C4A76_06385 [Brevibacillus laterosporus]